MGRKLEFSRDHALLQAMEAFWAQGYADTSMRDLAQRLNLHLGSVYNALGDKDAVFEQALSLYIETKIGPAFAAMATSDHPQQALGHFIDTVTKDCFSDTPGPGCFVINSLLDIGQISPKISALLETYLAKLEDALEACIRNGQSAGEIHTQEPPRQLARFVIATCKSMHVMKKLGVDDAYLNGLRNSLDRHLFVGLTAA